MYIEAMMSHGATLPMAPCLSLFYGFNTVCSVPMPHLRGGEQSCGPLLEADQPPPWGDCPPLRTEGPSTGIGAPSFRTEGPSTGTSAPSFRTEGPSTGTGTSSFRGGRSSRLRHAHRDRRSHSRRDLTDKEMRF